MKQRHGFVSNSSSSSYIIAGVMMDDDFSLSLKTRVKLLIANYDRLKLLREFTTLEELQRWEQRPDENDDYIYETFLECGFVDEQQVIGINIRCDEIEVLSLIKLAQLQQKATEYLEPIKEELHDGEVKLYWLGVVQT